MFDIGFQELLLIGVLSLLIMGPEKLPGAIRTSSLWISRLRNSFREIKADIEREIGADEIKQQIHNESIMQSLEKTGNDIVDGAKELKSDFEKIGSNLPYDVSGLDDSELNNRGFDDSHVDSDQLDENHLDGSNTKSNDDQNKNSDSDSNKQ